MVAGRLVPSTGPALRDGRLGLWLELPLEGGPRAVAIRMRRSAPLSLAQARALDRLGVAHLDAYLRVDGRPAPDEAVEVGSVAGEGSRITLVPRLRGGVTGGDVGDAAGAGQPSQLPLTVLPAGVGGPAPTAALEAGFPQLQFDDPVGPRTPSQLNVLAGTVKAFFELAFRRLEETNGRMEAMGASLRGDTAGLRDQAGAVARGLQEQASTIIA